MTDSEELLLRWPAGGHEPRMLAMLRLPGNCTGIVAVDDVRLGPAIGGLRMTDEVTPAEVARLAHAMTLKSAAAMLPHGGAKAGIRTPGPLDPARRESVIRAFARGIRDLTDYIPGPDMGTDETAMAWIHDEIGRAVGLPATLGGIPLDTIGATAYGLRACARALAEAGRLKLSGSRAAIQGFGAVGRHAARFLHQDGMIVVAVADRSATVYDPDGLDVEALADFNARRPLAEYEDRPVLPREAVLTVDCELLVPAAQPDVLRADNVGAVTAEVVLPGANIAATPAAEAALYDRGALCVPDFLANAGGVICAAVEHRGGSRGEAFAVIEERIRANTLEMVDRMTATGALPRAAAEAMARSRLAEAAAYRRRF